MAGEAALPLRPALLNAADTRDRERRLAAIYAALRPKLDQARLAGGWDGPAAALADLRRAAAELRGLAAEVLRVHPEFAAEGERYRRDLARGPAALGEAATYYREKAAAAPDRLLGDQYARLAANCLAHAALVRDREAAFVRFQADVSEAVAYTRRTHEFLNDFDAYAALVPAADVAEYRGTYRDCLAAYVKGFATFVALHDRYSDGLRGQPLPAEPGDPAPRPAPPADVYPGGGEHLVSLQAAAPDPAGRAEAEAARFGDEYVRARAAAVADCRALEVQLGRWVGRPTPPALQAAREDYERRAEYLNRVRVFPRDDQGNVHAGDDRLPPGTYLAAVRGGSREHVGVIRVGKPLGDGRYAATVVRGDVRPRDEAVQRPDSGWDRVVLAATVVP